MTLCVHSGVNYRLAGASGEEHWKLREKVFLFTRDFTDDYRSLERGQVVLPTPKQSQGTEEPALPILMLA